MDGEKETKEIIKKTKKKSIVKKCLKITFWTIFSIVFFLLAVLAIGGWYLSPNQLTPLAEKYANEALNADVKFGRVELTIWKTFPSVTVDIEDMSIVSHNFDKLATYDRDLLPAYRDSLLSVDKLHGGINIFKAVAGIYDIDDIIIDGPKINLVDYSETINNYDITKPSEEPFVMPDVRLRSIEIANGKGITYFSAPNAIDADVDVKAAQFVRQGDNNNKYQLIVDAFTSLKMGTDKQILDKLPINIISTVDWNIQDMMKFALNDCKINVGKIPITLSLAGDATDLLKLTQFKTTIGEFTFNEIRNRLPKEYADNLQDLESNCRGTVKMELTKPFDMSKDSVPSIKASFDIPDSYLKNKNGKHLDSFMMSVNADINGDNVDASTINLTKFTIKGESLYINATGSVTNLITDPLAKGNIDWNLNISKAINVFNIPVHYLVSGFAKAAVKFEVRQSEAEKKQFDKLGVHGDIYVRHLKIASKKDSLKIYANRAKMLMGTREKSLDRRVDHIFKGSISVDSLNLQYKGKKLNIIKGETQVGGVGNIAYFMDNVHYLPIGGSLTADRIAYTDVDSSQLSFKNFLCDGAFHRHSMANMLSNIDFEIKTSEARFRNKAARISLKNGNINLSFQPRVKRSAKIIDSLRRVHPKLTNDSILALSKKYKKHKGKELNITDDEEILDLAVDTALQGLLNRWRLYGTIKADKARLATPYFPIKNRISDLDVTMSLDSFIINHASYNAGRSTFDLTGGIRNMRTTFLGHNKRPLSIDWFMTCDTLDLNELIKASFAGINYGADKDKVLLTNSEEKSDSLIEQDINNNLADSTLTAVIIPSNVDATIAINARNAFYSDLKLYDFSGELGIHDGALNLSGIKTQSDAGSILLNALYAAKTKKDIKFAFDMNMKNIQLNRFINLLPTVDSIMPLLKSMDGVVTADIAATTSVDSSMNVIFPSLAAAMKIHGDSLVLFDSETFSKVSKMLHFKNKERNLIDNMTVELIIKDNQLQLFPFMFIMDRYKVGIMGSNDLAMNLKYHISVLKSPIPFKFGLNISGTPDKLKYGLCRAKFKEGEVGKVSSMVGDARVNLRSEIKKAFNEGVNAAVRSKLDIKNVQALQTDNMLSHEDSVNMIKEGLIRDPDLDLTPAQLKEKKKREAKIAKEKAKQDKKNKKQQQKLASNKDILSEKKK